MKSSASELGLRVLVIGLFLRDVRLRECKNKRKIQIITIKSVRVRLRECPATGTYKYRVLLIVQTGFWKGVRIWSCPLTRVSAQRESTVEQKAIVFPFVKQGAFFLGHPVLVIFYQKEDVQQTYQKDDDQFYRYKADNMLHMN